MSTPNTPRGRSPRPLTATERVAVGIGGAVALAVGVAVALLAEPSLLDAPSVELPGTPPGTGVPASPAAARERLEAFGPALVPLALMVGAIDLAVISGWPKLLGMPRRATARWTIGIVAALSLVVALFFGIGELAVLAALAIPVVYVGEMTCAERAHLLEQVAESYLGALIAISASMWIVALRAGGGEVVATAAIVLLGGTFGLYYTRGPVRFAAATGAGFAAGALCTPALIRLAGTGTLAEGLASAAILAVGYGLVAVGLAKVLGALQAANSGRAGVCFVLVPHSALGVLGYTLALLFL